MSKRFAGSQITREGLENEEHRSDDEVPMDKPKLASDSVMSGRKIAIPKRKMARGFAVNDKPSLPDMVKQSTIAQGSGTDETNEKLMALNLQFKDKIVKVLDNDPLVNLSTIFEKYKAYYSAVKSNKTALENPHTHTSPSTIPSHVEKIKEEPASNPFAFVKPVPAEGTKTVEKSTTVKSESDSEDEEDQKPIVVEGPKFVLTKKPTTNDSPFNFGTKRRNSDSDSESEVEIKGPQFTFSGSVSTGQFTLPKENTKQSKPSEPDRKPTQQLGSGLFGNSSGVNPVANQPSTPTEAMEKEQPKFNFQSDGGEKNKTVDVQATDKLKKTPFSFGSSMVDTKTPSFAFGSSAVSKDGEAKKPTFTFGVTNSQAKEENSQKPSFIFGSTTQNVNTDGANKPFVFGLESKTSEEGSKPIVDSASVKYETKDSNKPVFSFGNSNSENSKEGASAFTFGSTPSSSKAPSFTFETQKNNSEQSKPAFNFGSSITTQPLGGGSENAEKTNESSSSFKFTLPFASNSPQPSEEKGNNSENKAVGEDSTESNAEDSKPLSMSNGEENETLLFSQRAKLMLYNTETKAYDSRGVGEFKVLQQKDDKSKVRILCRSDGMGHILLNTVVVKSFVYGPLDPNNENLVKCPVVNAEGKLDTYIVKVKQKADGRKLAQSIVDAQKVM